LDRASLASFTSQALIKKVSELFTDFNRKARPYLLDSQIHTMWSHLVSLKATLNKKADKATAPTMDADFVDPTPASSADATKPAICNMSHLKLRPPTFNDNPMNWAQLAFLLDAVINDAKYLTDMQKATLLMDVMSDPQARAKVDDAATNETYTEVLATLTEAYGWLMIVFPLYMDTIFCQLPPVVYSSTGLMEAKA